MVCIKKTKRQDRGDERLENIINRLLLLFFSPRTVALVWAVRVVTARCGRRPRPAVPSDQRVGVCWEKSCVLLDASHLAFSLLCCTHFTLICSSLQHVILQWVLVWPEKETEQSPGRGAVLSGEHPVRVNGK